MKLETAKKLTALFQAKAGTKPRIIGVANICVHNSKGSEVAVTARTPEEVATWIEHIFEAEDGAPFQRENVMNTRGPITITMEVRGEEGFDKHEVVKTAFHMRLWDMDTKSQIVFEESYQDAPTAKEIIDVFKRAGRDWSKVDFTPPPPDPEPKPEPHLKLVP